MLAVGGVGSGMRTGESNSLQRGAKKCTKEFNEKDMNLTEGIENRQLPGGESLSPHTGEPAAEHEGKVAAAQSFGAVVRFFRTRAGLSQLALAKRVGFSTAEAIGMIEHGARDLALDRVRSMANALGIDALELTILALREYYPVAAKVLFGEAANTSNLPREATVVPQDELSAAGWKVGEKFDRLDVRFQPLVTGLIEALARSGRRN